MEQEIENDLSDRFAGALLGTFAGDALGMPVENWPAQRIARTFGTLDHFYNANVWLRGYAFIYGALLNPTGTLRAPNHLPLRRGTYTDDTQMMIAVAESLIDRQGFDGADMARQFAASFDPRRGYGRGTIAAVRLLEQGHAWDTVGARLFNGTGSFGNGAAMRVAPVALLYRDNPDALRHTVERSAIITHAHALGIQGAILQASAVAEASRVAQGAPFDTESFLTHLRTTLPSNPDQPEVFPQKLALVEQLLNRTPTVAEVVQTLGNNVTAQGSVPAALYAFLAHSASFAEAVIYAVSLGGDTDTIGAMTGALAGARHGVTGIPADWLEALENGAQGRDYIRGLAERLYVHYNLHKFT